MQIPPIVEAHLRKYHYHVKKCINITFLYFVLHLKKCINITYNYTNDRWQCRSIHTPNYVDSVV